MELTEKAITKMRHALGCDFMKPANSVQKYHRNFYAQRGTSDVWEELVTAGYATKREQFGETVYHITNAGIKKLGAVLGVHFKEEK